MQNFMFFRNLTFFELQKRRFQALKLRTFASHIQKGFLRYDQSSSASLLATNGTVIASRVISELPLHSKLQALENGIFEGSKKGRISEKNEILHSSPGGLVETRCFPTQNMIN